MLDRELIGAHSLNSLYESLILSGTWAVCAPKKCFPIVLGLRAKLGTRGRRSGRLDTREWPDSGTACLNSITMSSKCTICSLKVFVPRKVARGALAHVQIDLDFLYVKFKHIIYMK